MQNTWIIVEEGKALRLTSLLEQKLSLINCRKRKNEKQKRWKTNSTNAKNVSLSCSRANLHLHLHFFNILCTKLSYLKYSPIKLGFFSSCHSYIVLIPQEYGPQIHHTDSYSMFALHFARLIARGDFLSFVFFPHFFRADTTLCNDQMNKKCTCSPTDPLFPFL